MPSQVCALCREAPGAVFTADHPVCKLCLRELRRAEREDNGIDNEPACVQCGSIHRDHACMHLGVLSVIGL